MTAPGEKARGGPERRAPGSSAPVVVYQEALDRFRQGGADPLPLLRRMSELISLLDLTTTLSSNLSRQESFDAALLVVMGELQARRGCLLLRGERGSFEVKASRGLPANAPQQVEVAHLIQAEGEIVRCTPDDGSLTALGLEVLCPVFKGGQAVAALGLGPRGDGRPYGTEELGFLRSAAACAAAPIENALIYQELRQVNETLSVKVFQLNNLFDISRELTASLDEDGIEKLVTTTLMGQLLVTRCALYRPGDDGLVLAQERGIRGEALPRQIAESESAPVLAVLRGPTAVADLPAGALTEHLRRRGLALVVPLSLGGRARGFLAVGERAGSRSFSEEDFDFAQTLARQATAALENVAAQRLRLEHERRDREMQIARSIQESLFPQHRPEVAGFEIDAKSNPCHQVGGDYYDFIPLDRGGLALVVADVSGKGNPAAILMASVHASLRALAGAAPPPVLMQRLNRFLLASTQAHQYVTLFYAELDPLAHRLCYVNAGHVPPCRVGAGGAIERLTDGGPVLGLIEDAVFEPGQLVLAPGDLLAIVTDGVTEAASAEDREFGEEGLVSVLRAARAGTAQHALGALLEAVDAWTHPRGCADDLTALMLRAL